MKPRKVEEFKKDIEQFLEKDEVKEKYAKIKDTKARLDRVIQKIAELEAKNAAKNSEIKKDQNINERKEALLNQLTDGGAQSEHQEVSLVVDAKVMAQNFLQISQLQSDAGTAAPQPMIPGVQELLVQEAASSVVTHTEEYAQAIQEKKSLTKALLDTGVSLKRDIDTYASEHKWAGYAKSGLESLLKGVGYGVAVCAVSTVGAKFGTVAAIATAGGLVISGEATAEIINRGGEQLVDYAVSFADTPEEAAGYADLVISSLETVVTVAGAVGGYNAGKAIVGKLANLKARVPTKVGKAFKGKNIVVTYKEDVSAAKIGLDWNGPSLGKDGYGMAFENYVATKPEFKRFRLPENFKTFDFWNEPDGRAVSVKTLNTNDATYTLKPSQVYSKIKGYIDETLEFTRYDKGLDKPITKGDIQIREIQLGIPIDTKVVQLEQIQRAVEYGKLNNVDVVITRIRK